MSMSHSSNSHHHDDEERALPSPVLVEDGSDEVIAVPGLTENPPANADDMAPTSSFVMEDMDMVVSFNGSQHDNHVDDNYVKPERKMTDTTTVTAQSSFSDGSDDAEDCRQSGYNGDKPALLDALHEEDDCEHEEDEAKTAESCCCRWFKRMMLCLVFFAIVAFATVMIGAAVEKSHFNAMEGTNHYYQTPQVCGVDDPLADTGITFDSVAEVHEAGAQVAHCGDCGACSTAHDMAIMSKTANSLTSDSTRCAFKLFVGMKAVEKCMEERVGFTPACENCWLDNVSCSFRSCTFTCIKYKLFRQENNKDGGDDLNDCLKCDERSCGPQFIECSGANRRRMGVISDIGREQMDQCTSVDVDWMKLHPPSTAEPTQQQPEREDN